MAARPRSRSMGDLMRSPDYHMPEPLHMMYSRRLGSIMARAAETSKEAISSFLSSLTRLSEKELAALGHAESSCPICLNPFSTILTEEEMALVMDTPAHPIEDLGVTRLSTCGHVFCVKDIRNWVLQGHNNCPFCRSVLIDLPDVGDESLADEVNALGRQMQASLSAYAGARGTGVVPLTAEQVASLRSAITLLQQGDGPEGLDIALPPPTQSVEETEPDVQDDRDRFSSMYS